MKLIDVLAVIVSPFFFVLFSFLAAAICLAVLLGVKR
jgi:hypothetical protein